MPIRQIPFDPPVCLVPSAHSFDALQHLVEQHTDHLPVCEQGKLLGIVGVNDLLARALPVSARLAGGLTDLGFAGDAQRLLVQLMDQLRHLEVADIMHQPPHVLDEECPILEAVFLLNKYAVPLPVIDRDGRFRTMLSPRQVLAFLMNSATSEK
jgi:signal-transduction protein with cAMP-binding, CBS, and nucleotidyltransferase domain